jgi:hypothetical protein
MLGVERASLLGTQQNDNYLYSVDRPILAVTITGNTVGGAPTATQNLGGNGYAGVWTTRGPFSSGKHYAEATCVAAPASNCVPISFADLSYDAGSGAGVLAYTPGDTGGGAGPGCSYRNNGGVFGTSTSGSSTPFVENDIISLLVNLDTGTPAFEFRKNNSTIWTGQLTTTGVVNSDWCFCSKFFQANEAAELHLTPTYSVPSGYAFVGA